MGVESIQEGASSPILPWIGEVDLSVTLVVALLVGLTLWALLRPLSESLADMVAAQIESLTNFNPQTGESGGNTAAFGGA